MTPFGLRLGRAVLSLVVASLRVRTAGALEECRLLAPARHSGRHRRLVYGGGPLDRPKAGGVASRLTAHEGSSAFPSSPPTARRSRSPRSTTATSTPSSFRRRAASRGGSPGTRSGTRSPSGTPTGSRSCSAPPRASSIQRFSRFFRVAAQGGFEDLLAAPGGGVRLALARRLADRVRLSVLRQPHWKRYRGGKRARDLDLRLQQEHGGEDHRLGRTGRVADWHGSTVYYASDRGAPR